MSRFPRLTAAEVIKAFERAGFEHVRTRGSHAILKKPGHRFIMSIPQHSGRTVGEGLLRSQIEAAGLTLEEFLALL